MDTPYPVLSQQGPSKNDEQQKQKYSFRFDLSLQISEKIGFPEFSYAELLKDVQKKSNPGTSSHINEGSNQFYHDSKDRAEAESMALYFEEKYSVGKGCRKRRHDRAADLADVGYGYDETDPFVDDSECYDEVVPSSLTTQFGGFYINTGKLKFKQVSDDSNDEEDDEDSLPLSAHLKKKRKKSSFLDSDENDFRGFNGVNKQKKLKKHKGPDEKRRKLSLQGKDKLGKLSKGVKKKHTKVQLLVAKAKAQQHQNTADKLSKHGLNSNHSLTNGKATKSKLEDTHKDLLDFLDSQQPYLQKNENISITNSDVMPDIEGFNGSKLNRPSSADDLRKLPHSIPNVLKEKISSLTKIAKSNENEGKVKFFSPDVNSLLLGIEAGSQTLSSRERSGIYQHLTPHVPCSKDTLIKRMKKLHASKQDEVLRRPLERLKEAIDEVMDNQIQRYDKECAAQQLAKLDDKVALAASTDEDDDGTGTTGGEEKVKRVYAPRRKFEWTEKLRSLLFSVVKIKVQHYETVKNRNSQAAEDYIKNFLETEVKGLWPKGWMQGRTLFKESREIHQHLTGSQVKQKKVVLSGTKKTVGTKLEKKSVLSSSPTSANTSASVTKLHASIEGGKNFKQIVRETGISVSMSLDSSAAPEEDSTSKRNESLYKVTTSHSKDSVPKKAPNEHYQLKSTPQSKGSNQTKSLSSKNEFVPNNSNSLLKMAESIASSSSITNLKPKVLETNDDTCKTLKVWHDTAPIGNNSFPTGNVKITSSHKHPSKEILHGSALHSKASTSTNLSVSKSQSKKLQGKPAAESTHNLSFNSSQMDQYSAELFKFAMMASPGAPHLFPGMGFSPGVLSSLPTSASFDELTSYMNQQASMHNQLQTLPNSFPAYLAGIASSSSSTPTHISGKTLKTKTRSPVFGAKTNASKSQSKQGSISRSPEPAKKHQKSYVSSVDHRKSITAHHGTNFKPITTVSSEHLKKHVFTSPNMLANYPSSSNTASISSERLSQNSGKKSSFSSGSSGRSVTKFTTVGQSSAKGNSNSRNVNKMSYSYVSANNFPSNDVGSECNQSAIPCTTLPPTIPHVKYENATGRAAFQHETAQFSFPAAMMTNPTERDKAAMEALLSMQNHLQAGNR